MPQEGKQRLSKKFNRNRFQTCLFLPHLLYLFNDLQHHVISSHLTPTIFLHGAAFHFQYGTTSFINMLRKKDEQLVGMKMSFHRHFKDVRANCFCASLLHIPLHALSARI